MVASKVSDNAKSKNPFKYDYFTVFLLPEKCIIYRSLKHRKRLKTLTSSLGSWINFILNFCSFILFISNPCILSKRDVRVKSSIKFNKFSVVARMLKICPRKLHSLCYFMIADYIYIYIYRRIRKTLYPM